MPLKNEEKKIEPDSSPKKSVISSEDIILVDAIDTFLDEGEKTHTLALSKEKRNAFFKEHNLIKPLLLLASQNPLLEEGQYLTPEKRAHEGELFLPNEALKLLVHYKIIQHVNKPESLPYNTENLYIVNNNEKNLLDILNNLNLKDKEDAKFIVIDEIHVIPFYLRKDKDGMKCFIVDPEQGAEKVITRNLKKAFNNVQIIANDTLLQLDYFSCSTFGLKTLMYFVKHGPEIFPYLEKQRLIKSKEVMLLPAEGLMPELLKMCQTLSKLYPKLSQETKDTIVSKQRNIKLSAYIKEHELSTKEKTYNTKAIRLKYETFAFLNNCLQKDLDSKEKEELLSGKLPLKLKKIIDSFEQPKKTIHRPMT